MKYMPYSNQKKGMFLAFIGVIFITPDSLLIRLANLTSWDLIFYRGFIPFLIVFAGLIIIYKRKFFIRVIFFDITSVRVFSDKQTFIIYVLEAIY